MHLRRNCTAVHEFDQQASVLYSRFVKKVYDPKLLQNTVKSIRKLDRTQLLVGRPSHTDNSKVSIPFITPCRSIKKRI